MSVTQWKRKLAAQEFNPSPPPAIQTLPKTKVFRAADGENLVILACTVLDWSTRVTDGEN